MPRNVSVFEVEIETAIENIQSRRTTIIPRRLIEDEIEKNPGRYPKLGSLDGISLRMAISASVNRRPDAKQYGKRPLSWIIEPTSSFSDGATA